MKQSLLFIAFVLGCSPAAPASAPSAAPATAPAGQSVIEGSVRGTPYRGMPSQNPVQAPRETVGALLPSTKVVLRAFVAEDAPAGPVVATATTDAQGHYRLQAPPGTYFLCVTGSDAKYTVTTTGKHGRNFTTQDQVNTFEVVTVSAGQVLVRDLVVPQGWPV